MVNVDPLATFLKMQDEVDALFEEENEITKSFLPLERLMQDGMDMDET